MALLLVSALQASFLLQFLSPARVSAKQSQPASTDARVLLNQATALRAKGLIAEAASKYEAAVREATTTNDEVSRDQARILAAGCYIRLFRYREALVAVDSAFQSAITANNSALAGVAAANKSTLYLQLGDLLAASRAGDQAVQLLQNTSKKRALAQALLINGDIKAQLGRAQEAKQSFEHAIAVAHRANLPDVEGSAEEYLGDRLLDGGKTVEAEQALKEAKALFTAANDRDDLAKVTEDFAELALAKGELTEALRSVNEALATPDQNVPAFWPLLTKANVLRAMGRPEAALQVLSDAVSRADKWRSDVLPGDATQTRTAASLAGVYQGYVEIAGDMAIRHHDRLLARRAFETLSRNRVWTLREQFLSQLRRDLKLPPHYYELLTDLKSKQALVTLGTDVKSHQANEKALQEVRLELTDLENKFGLNSEKFAVGDEKDSHRTSLTRLQQSLTDEDLLLSFSLGEKRSFVWAMTRNQLDVYALPAASVISHDAQAFAQTVQQGQDFRASGQQLSNDIFSALPAGARNHRDWSLVADGALLSGVPFSALPDPAQPQPVPLTAHHTIRLLPAELLRIAPRGVQPEPSFVGIADPIYNAADARRRSDAVNLVRVARNPSAISLGRLVGSDREVHASEAVSGLPRATFLTGPNASGSMLAATLATQRPEVIHFAVHIVSPEDAGSGKKAAGEAALALSLTAGNIPELLTKENVAAFRVPGSLVILSGCASQQGDVLPSAGLVGLSRAWLLAGAAAVLVTAWPTPDNSGAFFQSFYAHLRNATGSLGERAAVALRDAQSDMQNSPGYRAEARFWAAYSLISKE